MQSFNWTPEHSAALRDLVAAGMSFSEVAAALNARFGTAYTRNAVLGRAKRMKLAALARPERVAKFRAPKPAKVARRPADGEAMAAGPAAGLASERPEPVKLRCVGIQPRLVSFDELAEGDCRYPYGGDREGEAISFCGHPRFSGTSYCAPHFHLTRGPRLEDERPAGPFVLRLVEAA